MNVHICIYHASWGWKKTRVMIKIFRELYCWVQERNKDFPSNQPLSRQEISMHYLFLWWLLSVTWHDMTTLLDVSNNGRTATSWWWWPSCEPQMSTTVLLFLWYKINYLLCKLKAKNNKKSFSINYLTCQERRKIHQTIQFSEKWITWVTDGQEEDAGCSWGIQEDGCGQWNLKRLLELVKGVAVWVSFLFL